MSLIKLHTKQNVTDSTYPVKEAPPLQGIILIFSVHLTAGAFIIFDLITDSNEGVKLPHVLIECGIAFTLILSALYLGCSLFKTYAGINKKLNNSLKLASEEALKWQNEHKSLTEGLSKAIDAQFSKWHLTTSESEVARLMLKGLSHKEIAQIRETSERTVRQQATSVYAKSSLANRSELLAFFLEDIL